VSDQDFFFDEDEKPAKPAASKSSPKSSSAKPAAKSAPAPSGGIELTWTVTALIGVVALLLGVIVGYAIPKGTDIASPDTTATQTGTNAPQLTPEQLSSGQLPAGHPAIGGATSTAPASGETTPSN